MQGARSRAANPERDQHAGEIDGGENRGDNADQENDRKAADRARSEIGHDRGRDDVRHIGIENRPERLVISGVDESGPLPLLLSRLQFSASELELLRLVLGGAASRG